jgi:short subunit dehydrogenase-like uncharacterized protein
MWLLYGANGTTGRILLRFLAEEGQRGDIPPLVIAGRREEAIAALAKDYGLPYRAFDLAKVQSQDFSGLRLVVNFAGPYEDTQGPWLEACAAHGLDYMDISGEWRSIGELYGRAAQYEALGRAVIVAAGFDTVAGEAALWMYLRKYPTAKRLRLGIYADGGFSAGTARSAFRMLPHGSWAYEGGRFLPLRKPRVVPLPDGRERLFWPATLAELKTFPAWQPIERLETYVAVPPRYGRWTPFLERVTAIAPVARLLDRILVSQRLRLATEMDLSAPSFLFVEADNGEERLWMKTEQAYLFTARAVLETVRLYFQKGAQPGVASAFSRYPEALWERLSLEATYQQV